MKVELEGSLRKAMLKGCLWMNNSEEASEGEQDEASQQHAKHNCHRFKAESRSEKEV
jgi:hypothetical protein